ncbi:MAG: hypothetical protein P9M03_10760, partial [Candidatus Theseobacter exili]|nr:hypothetical protein [Candidatus Theseobacter exili]
MKRKKPFSFRHPDLSRSPSQKGIRVWMKTLSVALIVAFQSSNMAMARGVDSKMIVPKEGKVMDAIRLASDTLQIPHGFGSVRERFAGSEDRLVIHIQDAHCNFEAQSNSARIMKNLLTRYRDHDLKLVEVEGASGRVNTAALTSFPDTKIKQDVGRYLLKKGKITAAEYLSIIAEKPLMIRGFENMGLYFNDVVCFLKSTQMRANADRLISQLKDMLKVIRNKAYSPELLELTKQQENYDNSENTFANYGLYLQKLAGSLGIKLSSFSNFERMLEVDKLENSLDFDGIEKERLELVNTLSENLPSEDVSELLSQSLYYRLERTTPHDYFTFLEGMLADHGISIKDKLNFAGYLKMLKLFEEIDREIVFKEADEVVLLIKNKLYTTPEQKRIGDFEEYLTMLNAFYYLEMTRANLRFFFDNKNSLNISELVSFIQKENKRYNFNFQIDPSVYSLNRNLPTLERFYEIAEERDHAIVDNALKDMKKEGVGAAILVAGGFHTEGITKIFKEKGVSYVVVTPRISKIDVKTPYISIMKDERSVLEKLVQSTQGRYAKRKDSAEKPVIQQALSSRRTVADMLGTMIMSMNPQELTRWLKENPNPGPEIRNLVITKLESIDLFDIVSKGLFDLLLAVKSWEEVKKARRGTPAGVKFKTDEAWRARFETMIQDLPAAEQEAARRQFDETSNTIRVHVNRIERINNTHYIPFSIAGVEMGVALPADVEEGEDVSLLDNFESSVKPFASFQAERLAAVLLEGRVLPEEALQAAAEDLYVRGIDVPGFLNQFKQDNMAYAGMVASFLETFNPRNFQLGEPISNDAVNPGIAAAMGEIEQMLEADSKSLVDVIGEGRSAFIES